MGKARVKVTFNNRALKKAVLGAVENRFGKVEAALNALVPQYEGKPLPEVEAAVSGVWTRETSGMPLPDEHRRTYAEQIAAGGRITLRVTER